VSLRDEAALVLRLVVQLSEQTPGCGGILTSLRAAVAGELVSLDPASWMAEFAAAEESELPLGGCLQKFWRRWRRLLPDRADFWKSVLLFGWRDQKISEHFNYAIPDRLPPPGQRAAFESVYRELEQLGVVGPSEATAATTFMFPVPKDDGSARYVSDLTHHNMNELVPHFQGTSEQMFLDWLRPNALDTT